MSDAAGLSPGRTLWEALGDIPDRRGAKGRRYPLRSVLTLSLAAMLAGGNDLCSIFRWGRRTRAGLTTVCSGQTAGARAPSSVALASHGMVWRWTRASARPAPSPVRIAVRFMRWRFATKCREPSSSSNRPRAGLNNRETPQATPRPGSPSLNFNLPRLFRAQTFVGNAQWGTKPLHPLMGAPAQRVHSLLNEFY